MSLPILCLMGPTASGKTEFALELAERLPCEIISVDSVMVYRGLDIGTAKPDKNILSRVPHHLINVRDPSEIYSVGEFLREATAYILAIIAKGRIPLLVGGTMLYFRALHQGLAQLPHADPILRAEWQIKMEKEGVATLYHYLTTIDPEAATRIHPQDKQRIQRAIEVITLTGQSITALQQNNISEMANHSFYFFALCPPDRKILHQQIALRFQHMLANGFIEEAKGLYDRGDLSLTLPAMRAVGYKQAWEYFSHVLQYDEMCEQAICATRQLAKRQLTWLRSWPALRWLTGSVADRLTVVYDCLSGYI